MDGGLEFTSRAFKEVCASWGICHAISSFHHHEANGAAKATAKTSSQKWERECRRLPHRPLEFKSTPRALTGPANPSCCLGATFSRKCCHTPAHSSSNSVSSGTLWTGQPQRSQLKLRRNTTCALSPSQFSNQAPSSGCNTREQSVGTRWQKWWSASLAGAAMVSRQRAVACSGATTASCASSFHQSLRREIGPGCFALH